MGLNTYRFHMKKDTTVVLITGASSGIGKATAKQLLSEGYIVYGAARKVEKMEDLKEAGMHVVSLDVADEASRKRCVETVINEQGRIDVLFNNAGFGLYGTVEETPLQDARYQFDVNLFGLAGMTQLVLPSMRKQKSGKIINTSSMGGKIYTPLGAWYHATKHAVEGFSDCLRLELEPFGIGVVVIEPGIIQTSFGDVLLDPLLKTSGDGPYKEMVQKMAKATKASYKKGGGSPPSVVAEAVSKAIAARKPKTRYVPGKMGKLLIFIRKHFGDRMFDRFIATQVK